MLKTNDCREVLNKDILIGLHGRKKLTFNPWTNHFYIYIDNDQFDNFKDVNDAVKRYNEIKE